MVMISAHDVAVALNFLPLLLEARLVILVIAAAMVELLFNNVAA